MLYNNNDNNGNVVEKVSELARFSSHKIRDTPKKVGVVRSSQLPSSGIGLKGDETEAALPINSVAIGIISHLLLDLQQPGLAAATRQEWQ